MGVFKMFKNMFKNMFEKVLKSDFGPILSSKVRQLHYITDRCSSEEIRPGYSSICHSFACKENYTILVGLVDGV